MEESRIILWRETQQLLCNNNMKVNNKAVRCAPITQMAIES